MPTGAARIVHPAISASDVIPVAEDLEGRVLFDAFDEDFRAGRGRERVPSWGVRAVAGSSTASPADVNMLEQLRGLGYIE